jgi:hypothetical protein
MLAHCPSHRLLPKLCATVSGDKNGRLRQSAADYLLRALTSWEPADYERQQEAVERAVLAAAQDAQAETRAVGRSMYGAYAHAWPAQAHAMLGRLGRDKQLQEKLCQAAEEYVPGGWGAACLPAACLAQHLLGPVRCCYQLAAASGCLWPDRGA